jgi:hypothetical protein
MFKSRGIQGKGSERLRKLPGLRTVSLLDLLASSPITSDWKIRLKLGSTASKFPQRQTNPTRELSSYIGELSACPFEEDESFTGWCDNDSYDSACLEEVYRTYGVSDHPLAPKPHQTSLPPSNLPPKGRIKKLRPIQLEPPSVQSVPDSPKLDLSLTNTQMNLQKSKPRLMKPSVSTGTVSLDNSPGSRRVVVLTLDNSVPKLQSSSVHSAKQPKTHWPLPLDLLNQSIEVKSQTCTPAHYKTRSTRKTIPKSSSLAGLNPDEMYKAALSFKFAKASTPQKPKAKALKTPMHKPIKKGRNFSKTSSLTQIFLRSANA